KCPNRSQKSFKHRQIYTKIVNKNINMSQSQNTFKPRATRNSRRSVSEPENDPNDENKNNKRPTNVESELLLAEEMFKKSNNNNKQNKKQKAIETHNSDSKEIEDNNHKDPKQKMIETVNDSLHNPNNLQAPYKTLESSIHNPNMSIDNESFETANNRQ